MKLAWHSAQQLTLRSRGSSSSSAALAAPAEAAVGAVGGEIGSARGRLWLGVRLWPGVLWPGVGGVATVGAVARSLAWGSGNCRSPSKTTVVEGVSSTFSEDDDDVISLCASASGGGMGGGRGACEGLLVGRDVGVLVRALGVDAGER